MENFALIALAEQLKPAMADLTIRRVTQHQPNGFMFHTRSSRLPVIKVLMDARFPALYGSEDRPPVETENSDFLMVLRKHLVSAVLVEFRKPLAERVMEFDFKTVVPSRELERVTLAIELIPNAPNIVLLDQERRRLASFTSATRQPPVAGGKIPLDRLLEEDFVFPETIDSAQALVTQIAGLGPVFAREAVERSKRSTQSIGSEVRAMLAALPTASAAWIYSELPLTHILEQNDLRLLEKAIVSPLELQSLERSHSRRTFASMQEAVRFHLDALESRSLLERAKLPALRRLRAAAKRLAERERKLSGEQTKFGEAEALNKTAQMLTASGMKMDQRYATAAVTDYYGDAPAAREVELDAALTLRENIDRMFHKHRKAGRGRGIVAKQLEEVHSQAEVVGEQTRRLAAIRDWDTWLAIEKRIRTEEQAGKPAAKSPLRVATARFRGIVVDGFEILVGRNSRENDALTFQIAAADDFWLHTGDYSGSHVVIRNPTRAAEPPENALTKAAQLAAYFSRARNSAKVEVHYTRRKHVSKPRRAKPGLVRLQEFKSIAVEPHNWLEE